jgi:hypothetical protein
MKSNLVTCSLAVLALTLGVSAASGSADPPLLNSSTSLLVGKATGGAECVFTPPPLELAPGETVIERREVSTDLRTCTMVVEKAFRRPRGRKVTATVLPRQRLRISAKTARRRQPN